MEKKTPKDIAISLVDEMQLSLSKNDVDFADNQSDIVCAKIAVKFAIRQNEKIGLLTGLYERVLTELYNIN